MISVAFSMNVFGELSSQYGFVANAILLAMRYLALTAASQIYDAFFQTS